VAKKSSTENFQWAKKIVNGVIGNRATRRAARRAQGTLGITQLNDMSTQVYRDPLLEKFDSYYECRQFDRLPEWDRATDPYGDHIPVRQRKPRFVVPYSRTLAERLTAKLIGASVFPTFKVEDAPEDQLYLEAIIREAKLKQFLLEPVRRMLNTGSIFVHFNIKDGAFVLEWHPSKFCYPAFTAGGELEKVEIKYLYDDPEETDLQGNPKKRWYKLEIGNMAEILYDNPEYVEGEEPVFTEVERVDHGLGFVQGEWFRTSEQSSNPDGSALVADIMAFIDEICYSLSQSSHAVGYNQDPQMILKNMDPESLGELIRSAAKAWSVGRDGEASFLEADMGGVEKATDLRAQVKQHVQDFSRVVLLDPEKIVGSAQSAKAMEVLHGPLKDVVDELRLVIDDQLKNLVLKMAMTNLLVARANLPSPVIIPTGWAPKSLAVILDWPPIFQQTMEDLSKKVDVAAKAKTTGLISPRTATRFVAKDFGIQDVEAELKEIAEAQKEAALLNPFGGF
jgi:hypothetical protein